MRAIHQTLPSSKISGYQFWLDSNGLLLPSDRRLKVEEPEISI